jgi:hypothetical protein
VAHRRASADTPYVPLGKGQTRSAAIAGALMVAGAITVLGQQPSPDAPPVKPDPIVQTKPDPNALADAIALLGGGVQSLRFSGAGLMVVGGAVGDATPAATPRSLKSYEVLIDYPSSAMQIDLVVDGELPVAAETSQAHHIEAISGAVAWDMTLAVPALVSSHKKPHGRASGAPSEISITEPARLNPSAAALRGPAIWMTPHGFLKAALANQPALRPAGAGTEVSFYAGANRYVGFLNSKHQVERVRIWVHVDRGEVLLDTTYTGYAAFSSLSYPTRIRQLQNGQLVADLTVTAVQPNVPVHLPVPKALGAS